MTAHRKPLQGLLGTTQEYAGTTCEGAEGGYGRGCTDRRGTSKGIEAMCMLKCPQN